jgi:hypothetical protein
MPQRESRRGVTDSVRRSSVVAVVHLNPTKETPMRTVFAVLAFALAVPAAATPADACGGYGDFVMPRHHEVSGNIVNVWRDDHGRIQVWVSYPNLDGFFTGRYADQYELVETPAAKRLLRDAKRLERRGQRLHTGLRLTRTGEAGGWTLIARPAHVEIAAIR